MRTCTHGIQNSKPGYYPPTPARAQRFRWALAFFISLSACSRNDQGTSGTSTQSGQSAARQTPYSQAAPDAQPQFGEVGDRLASRVITNAAGQAGLSIAETNLPNATGQTPPAQNQSDLSLAQKVRVGLSTGTTGTTGTYATDTLIDIGVTATNGIVTLTGAVGSLGAREALEQRAKAMQGVKGVNNQLTISPTARNAFPGAPAGRGQADIVPQQSGSGQR